MDETARLIQDYLSRVGALADARETPFNKDDLRDIALELGMSDHVLRQVEAMVEAHLTRGRGYNEHGLFNDAIKELNAVAAASPFRVDVLFELATAHHGRWKETEDEEARVTATALAQRCLDLDPADAGTYDLMQLLKSKPASPLRRRWLTAAVVLFLVFALGWWAGRGGDSTGPTDAPAKPTTILTPFIDAVTPDRSSKPEPVLKAAGEGVWDAEPQVLVQDQQDPEHLMVDQTHLYWSTRVSGTVSRLPKTGGEVEVLATFKSAAQGLTMDAGHLYVGARDLMKLPKAGGTPIRLATHSWGPMAGDENHVYFWREADLCRVPKSGGETEVMAKSQTHPRGLFVDDQGVYWSSDGKIKWLSKDGASLKNIAVNEGFPHGVVADQTHIFWTANYGHAIRRVSRSGGEAQTLAEGDGHFRPIQIVQDEVALYWTAPSTNLVQTVAKAGGAVFTVPSNVIAPAGLAIDDEAIYWSNGDGTVMRIAKPKR